jgi:multiple sugar transport system substrate-binding protein
VAVHFHVWKSLIEQAGFTIEDIPKEWDAFWSFWCDDVQPAVRKTVGREDLYGIAMPMSVTADTWIAFYQFMIAYEADYVTPDGKLMIDDNQIRHRLADALQSYSSIYRKGCTPPDSTSWGPSDNNTQFLTQGAVTTVNISLSVPNALKRDHPDDYYDNSATIEWPLNDDGEAFPIWGQVWPAMAFREGGNPTLAQEFVGFLVREGWLAHYLNFSGERVLPPMQKLLDQPLWLDPTDRHRMVAVIQLASRPTVHNYAAASGNWRHLKVDEEGVWAKAVHRVVADGITPEQAVDEAIARTKEILSE